MSRLARLAFLVALVTLASAQKKPVAQMKTHRQERDAITADQARLRENMKALKGSTEEKALLQRYTRQLDQQEDRLTALQSELSDLNSKKERADQELDQLIHDHRSG
jgi:chromosome segregation ATPase